MSSVFKAKYLRNTCISAYPFHSPGSPLIETHPVVINLGWVLIILQVEAYGFLTGVTVCV